MFENMHITIFITGGIAAYKVPQFVRLLQKAGSNVQVVMSQNARHFVTPEVFETLLHKPVYTELFNNPDAPIPHIEIADWTDLAIVVPATANIIAKMANGIADDLLSSTLLATNAPKYVVPAMNTKMLANPATQRNLRQLTSDGIQVLKTTTGHLAEGYEGQGRMLEPEEIFQWVELLENQRMAAHSGLQGKKIVVTAGGTRERIDPVRYITNDSSGKMGYALAQAAAYTGAEVTLISTVQNLPVPLGVQVSYVESAQEMQQALNRCFAELDILIMAAAVSDYRPATIMTQKIKKHSKDDLTNLKLVKNPDILKALGQRKTHQFLVGFAAETKNLQTFAEEKLAAKNADMIIANDVSQKNLGFNSDYNAATVLSKDAEPVILTTSPKQELAQKIIALIAQHFDGVS